jgi:hypothetical protein
MSMLAWHGRILCKHFLRPYALLPRVITGCLFTLSDSPFIPSNLTSYLDWLYSCL